MTRKILLLPLLLFCLSTYAQNGIKVYGFEQEQSPGTIPKGTDEEGRSLPHNKSTTNYLIYLAAPRSVRVTPVEVWIKGEAYSVKTEAVSRTPVAQKDNVGKTVVLVPATSQSVRKLTLLPYMPKKEFSRAKEKAKSNEVVVVYLLNGKYYSALLKNLKKLEPRFNE